MRDGGIAGDDQIQVGDDSRRVSMNARSIGQPLLARRAQGSFLSNEPLLFTEAELQAVKYELRKIGERQIRVHGEGSKGVGLMIAIPLPYEPDAASRWFLLKPRTPIVDEIVAAECRGLHLGCW